MPPLPRRAAPVLVLALLLLLLPLATAGCTYLGAATAIVLGTGALDDGGRGGGAGGPGGTLNANTTAEIVDLPRTAAGTQPVVIRLIDAEGDRVNLRLEFRDAGAGAADFRAATLATVRRLRDGETVAGGPTTETGLLDTGPDGTEYVLDWSYEQDLGPGARASVTLRLVVVGTVDAPGGVAFTSENRKIGNEPPLATNVRVVGGRDLVFVRFDLADSSGDICAVDAFFTIEGEARQVLTPVDPGSVVNLQTAAAPREISFLWDTADPTQVGRRRVNVFVEVVPVDEGGLRGAAGRSALVAIANNEPPQAFVQPPPRAVAGTATIRYALVDAEGDATDIAASYETLESTPRTGAARIVGGDPLTGRAGSPGAGTVYSLVWDYATDLGSNAATLVRFQVAPAATGAAAGSATFLVGNDAPQAAVPAPPTGTFGDDVPIGFTLLDSTADPAAVAFTFSTNGVDFANASSASATVGLATADPSDPGQPAAHTFVWQTARDLPGFVGQATLRLVPNDGLAGGVGAPVAIAITIDNFVDAPPEIASITPAQGRLAGGVRFAIVGANFVAGDTQVSIGLAAATDVDVASSTALTGRTPFSAVGGPADVVVTTTRGSATRAGAFTYTDAPAIASIAPPDGPLAGLTDVTISGTSFTGATRVEVGGQALQNVVVVDDATITGRTPPAPGGTAGAVAVLVETPGGQASLGAGFRYLAPPTVTAVDPARGPTAGGTRVQVTGTGFLASTVTPRAGGLAMTGVAVLDDTTLLATTPAAAGGAAGPVDVSVETPGGTGTAMGAFTYLAQPTVDQVMPAEGPTAGGTRVTLTGTGFVTGAGATTVTIGGRPLENVAVAGATSLEGDTPASAAGPVAVAVTTPGGTGVKLAAFTYVEAPTVSAIFPDDGPEAGGTAVTIAGTGFSASGLAVTVGGSPLQNLAAPSDTLITGNVPGGTPGARDIVVTTARGTATLAGGFTYIAAPTFAAAMPITPVTGGVAGDTPVTIAGANFVLGATTVTVGGGALRDLVVVDPATITGKTPPGTAGPADVVVTTPGGEAMLAGGFTYVQGLTVALITPAAGSVRGGDPVTIVGSGFVAGAGMTTARIGPNALVDLVVDSSAVIRGRTPPGTIGLADVVVAVGASQATLANGFRYAPTVSFRAFRTTTPDEADAAYTIELVLETDAAPLAAPISFDVRDTGTGTATSAKDYAAFATTGLTFAAGALDGAMQTVGVSVIGDRLPEANETVVLGLANVTGGAIPGVNATHRLVITDDESRVVSFTASPARAQIQGMTDLSWVVIAPPAAMLALEPGPIDVTGQTGETVTPFPTAAALAPAVDPRVSYKLRAGRAGDPEVLELLSAAAAPGGLASATAAGLAADRGLVAAGLRLVAPPFTFESRFVRVDAAGGEVFSARSDSSAFATAGAAAFPDGSALFVGNFSGANRRLFNADGSQAASYTATGASQDAFLVRFDPAGRVRWSAQVGGTGLDAASAAVALPDGTAVVTGTFAGTNISFGPGEAGSLSASGGGNDAFIVRYDQDASIVWLRRAGGSGFEGGDAIAAYPDGGVVVGGRFNSANAVFGPGEANETTLATTAGSTDLFVARYGPDGRLVWVARATGTGSEQVFGVAAFSDGSAAAAGDFAFGSPVDSVTFGPGEPNETTLTSGNPGSEPYVARFDADGTLRFAKRIDGAGQIFGLAGLPDGSIVVTGNFTGTATFNPGEPGAIQVTAAGGTEVFIARYDRDGAVVQAVRAGGGFIADPRDIASLPTGELAVVGSFSGTATFGEDDVSETTLTSAGAFGDAFVARYGPVNFRPLEVRPEGIHFARGGDGTQSSAAAGAARTPDGGTLVAGAFRGSEDLGGGALAAAGGSDAFLARFDAGGAFVGAVRAGGTQDDEARAVVVRGDGEAAYVAGSFRGTATFGPGEAGQTMLASAGGADIFVARHDPDLTLHSVVQIGGAGDDEARGLAIVRRGPDEAIVVGRSGVDGLIVRTDTGPGVTGPIFERRIVAAAGGEARVESVAAYPDGLFCVVAGRFAGTVTFGPGEPPGFLRVGETTLASAGGLDAFVAGYHANGDLGWVHTIAGAGDDEAIGVAILPDGNAAATGYFTGTATVSAGAGGALVSAGGRDVFVVRVAARFAGTVLGAARTGDAQDDTGAAIAARRERDTAGFGGFVVAGPTSAGFLLAAFAADGVLAYERRTPGAARAAGLAVALDGSVALVGELLAAGPTTFGPGEANATPVSFATGTAHFFAAKLFPYAP